jgi:transposase-like protein
LARVIHHLTGHQLHHHTVKTLCERFFFRRHSEFRQLVRYPVPTDPQALRLEVVRLSQQGWTEIRTAELLRTSRKTVRKWLRRARQQGQQSDGKHSPLAVLGEARGARIEPADLQRAFGQRYCQRMTDARGFARIGRW